MVLLQMGHRLRLLGASVAHGDSLFIFLPLKFNVFEVKFFEKKISVFTSTFFITLPIFESSL